MVVQWLCLDLAYWACSYGLVGLWVKQTPWQDRAHDRGVAEALLCHSESVLCLQTP